MIRSRQRARYRWRFQWRQTRNATWLRCVVLKHIPGLGWCVCDEEIVGLN